MLNQRLVKILDTLSYVFVLLTILVVPLVLDKNLVNIYTIPKEYVFIGLALIGILLYTVKVALAKKLVYRQSILDLPLLGLLLVALICSIFSVNVYDSFFGRSEYFILNFIFLTALVLFYLLVTNLFTTVNRWRLALDGITLIGGLTALIFVLKMVFHVDLLSSFGSVWNTVDKINSTFGVWMIIIFVLSMGQFIKKNLSVGRSVFVFFVALLSITSLIMLSFQILWWLLLLGVGLLLMMGLVFVKETRMWSMSILFASLVMVVIFIIFGTPKYLQSAVPVEISLGVHPSWTITSHTLTQGVKSFLIGSGLGSFGVDFSKYRTTDFNYDNTVWSLRFSQPYSSFMAMLAEGGVLLPLLFVFLALFVLGHVFYVWYTKMRDDQIYADLVENSETADTIGQLDVFLTVISWIVLTVGIVIMFYGPVLWWLWSLLLGLIITGLSFVNDRLIKTREWTIEDSPQYSLSFSFLLIVLMAGVIMLGVGGVRLYMGEVEYANAMQSSDYTSAENSLKAALDKRSSSDIYHASLAQVYLMEAIKMSKETKPDIQGISSIMALAVNEAKQATDISPQSVALWENLATMYENAAALVPEARDWAIKSWQQAKDLEPTNPVTSWRLGNNYAAESKWDDAIKNYQAAISLKSDYLGAYEGLASAYEQENKIDDAIKTYQSIGQSAASNVEILYNYGRLLYNRNKTDDRKNAESLWERVIQLQPNYSNALYSLGLLYETKGDKTTALQYYYKVKDLNPDNKDIIAKIKSLTK